MGAAEAYQAGGWPLVTIILAGAVIVYLVRENREFRRRIDTLTDATRTMLTEYQKRDTEELKELRRRDQETRR